MHTNMPLNSKKEEKEMSKKKRDLFVIQEYDNAQIAYGLAEIELERAVTEEEKAKARDELEKVGRWLDETRKELKSL